jgi:hypothetical protein
MHTPHGWFTDGFRPISLAALNDKAGMLERLDNKYVVTAAVLREAAPALQQGFDVLEIDERRAFTYETIYFDDARRSCYLDHLQGRRQRMKVRMRRYVDSRLCFVEVKLKDRRGITVKKRLDHDPACFGQLDERAIAHVRTAWQDLYGREFDRPLVRTVEMRYRRITLVARQGAERLTIDTDLSFTGSQHACSVDRDTFIIETKSANGNGIADRMLRALHEHPTPGCSKYCAAMAALREVGRNNRFLPALRKLGLLPGRPAALSIGAHP